MIAFFEGHSSQGPPASPVSTNLVPARLVLECSETGSTFKLREAGKMNSEQTQSSSSEQNQSSAPSPSQPALNNVEGLECLLGRDFHTGTRSLILELVHSDSEAHTFRPLGETRKRLADTACVSLCVVMQFKSCTRGLLKHGVG